MLRRVRTVLVDGHGLSREGLNRILSETAFRVAFEGATLEEALEGFAEGNSADLLLLSAYRDELEAAALQVRQFRECFPSGRVVVLTDHCDYDELLSFLQSGANGLVLRGLDHRALAKLLDLVMLGETVLSPAAIDVLTRRPHSMPGPCEEAIVADRMSSTLLEMAGGGSMLSSRETEILECLTRGEANKLIARKFAITEATVKVHVKAILRKIQVKNRTQAALWAQRNLMPSLALREAGEREAEHA